MRIPTSLDGPASFTRYNPADGAVVRTLPMHAAAAVDTAVGAARAALDAGSGSGATGAHRARLLNRVADVIEAASEDPATVETRKSGKPIAQARQEIAGAIDIWRRAAALARPVHSETQNALGPHFLGLTVHEPTGVVAIVMPWNFPFLTLSQKLPFALAAGCVAPVKPSDLISGSALMAAEVLSEAGLPEAVVQILTGTGTATGAPPMGRPGVDMISFTGSTRVGWEATRAAAGGIKKVSLELGGENPQIVFADADLDAAADAIVFGAWFNAGECCSAGSRLLVKGSVERQLVEKVVSLSRTVRMDDLMDEATQVGAIIHEDHLKQIEAHVAQARAAGATVVQDGERMRTEGGFFMGPTIHGGRRDLADGDRPRGGLRPRAVGHRLRHRGGARDRQRDGVRPARGGLERRDGPLPEDGRRAARPDGLDENLHGRRAELPFGGYLQSGLGRELGPHAVLDRCETKTFTMRMNPRTPWASGKH